MRTITEKIDEIKSIMFQALKVSGQTGVFSMELVQKLESLIEQREREACVEVCKTLIEEFGLKKQASLECANAIKARGRA